MTEKDQYNLNLTILAFNGRDRAHTKLLIGHISMTYLEKQYQPNVRSFHTSLLFGVSLQFGHGKTVSSPLVEANRGLAGGGRILST